jgi:hypothetical protein
VKKKVAATRIIAVKIIAAAEMRIGVVEFELAGCLDRDVILAGASEG